LIVGPANNQLADEDVLVRLQERGITWVPDVIASAGGIIHAVCREELDLDEAAANARIDAIGDKVRRILEVARDRGTTTLQAARAVAAESSQAASR
jgi:leucine dehydrogenase